MKPRPRGFAGWSRLFLCGACMGAADLVPGVSGGTVALMLRIYSPFIKSLCTLDQDALSYFATFQWRRLLKHVAWQFLCALGIGMALAILLLAPLFHTLLESSDTKRQLFSFFSGLIIASSFFCLRRVPNWSLRSIGSLFAGAGFALCVTLFPLFFSFQQNFILESQATAMIWVFFCGVVAVAAMLLPGLSGSYLLTILGAYPLIIESLSNVSKGVLSFSIPLESCLVLLSLGCGIALGALFFTRLIQWFLTRFLSATLACMVGFMIGALPAVWPFGVEPVSTMEIVWLFVGLFLVVVSESAFLFDKTPKRHETL